MSTASPAVRHNPVLVVVALCLGGLGASLSQTLVIPIQSDLPRLLGTSASNTSWVVTITLLGGAVAMPIAGRVADMIGKQRVLIASAILLLIGSLVAALSNTIGPLLVGRALQGLAMGFIPVGISLIREVTPRQLASRSIAAMSATLGVGAAVGLPLAAWIDEVSSWHALFWMEAGVALVMVILAAILVPHLRDGVPGRFDITGGLGLTAGLVLFLVGISKGNDWGWATGRTVGAIVAGIVVLVLWAVFELRQREPLVDLRTSAARPVLMTNIAAVAVGFGMMAASVVMPQLVQLPEVTGYGMGLSVLQAGLLMAPAGFAMMLAAVFSTRVIAQFGAKAALMVGATVLGAGYVLSFFLMDAPWQLLVSSCVSSRRRDWVCGHADRDPGLGSREGGRFRGWTERVDALDRDHLGRRRHGYRSHQRQHLVWRLRLADRERVPMVLSDRGRCGVSRCRHRGDHPSCEGAVVASTGFRVGRRRPCPRPVNPSAACTRVFIRCAHRRRAEEPARRLDGLE